MFCIIQWNVICELFVQLNVVYSTICELLVGIYRGMWLMLKHTMFYHIKCLLWTDHTNASMILAVCVLAFCVVSFCLYCLLSFFVLCLMLPVSLDCPFGFLWRLCNHNILIIWLEHANICFIYSKLNLMHRPCELSIILTWRPSFALWTNERFISHNLISTCAGACVWLFRRKCACWRICSNLAA